MAHRESSKISNCAFALSVVALVGIGGRAYAQVTDAETRVLDRLNAERVEKQMEHLSTGIVRNDSGAGSGTATGGTADEAKIAAYVEAELRSVGLDVHQESFPVRRYEYGPVSLHVNGVKYSAISVGGGGGTWGTKDGVPYQSGNSNLGHTLHAPLVYVAGSSEADFQRAGDVKGRVVLMNALERMNAPVLQAAHHGAAALLIFRASDPGDGTPPEAMAQVPSSYHDQIPTLIVGEKTAGALMKALKAKSAMVDLENRIDSSDGTSSNVIATITGSQFPDEIIMVSSHYDRWWQSVNDNEAGTAAMIEIGRVIAAGYKPKRTIMFVSTGSEEFGRADTQVDFETGSAAFAAAHPEIMRRLVYDRNFDLAGWTSAKGTMLSSPEIVGLQSNVISDLGLADKIVTVAGQDPGTDAWNFGAVGGGATSLLVYASRMLSHNAAWDPKVEPDPFWRYSHTQFDLFRHEWYLNLSDELRISTLSVLRADEALHAPVDFVAVAKWAIDNVIADSKKLESTSFAHVQRSLSDFRAAAESIEGERAKVTDSNRAHRLNSHLLNIRRDLMPWLYANASTSFRTTPLTTQMGSVLTAIGALRKQDSKAALAALAEIPGLSELASVAPAVEQRMRVESQTSNDSGLVYRQFAAPPSSELVESYRAMQSGTGNAPPVAPLESAYQQLSGQLRTWLAIVSDKVDHATAELIRTPVILQ